MLDLNPAPTQEDIDGLVDKLVQFDASLTPAQRSIFRGRIMIAVSETGEVEGHNWEMRWQPGSAGMFRRWVYVDDNPTAPTQPHSSTEQAR